MRFLRGKEEAVQNVVDQMEADLTDAKERLAELEAEAEGIQKRVVLAALAGDAEEFVAAQMRENGAQLVAVSTRAAAATPADLRGEEVREELGHGVGGILLGEVGATRYRPQARAGDGLVQLSALL